MTSDLHALPTNVSARVPALPESLRTAVIFAAAVAVVNGFGRFAYALLLPVMRDDLHWDYALSGWLNTANSVGYGLGAIFGMLLLGRIKSSTLFVWGLAIAVATLLAGGVTRELPVMMLLRFLCGIGSSWVFACGGALIATKYGKSPAQSASAIAVYYAGGGLGIALSGVLIYPVLSLSWTWPVGWVALGLAGFVLAIWPSKLALDMGQPLNHAGGNQLDATMPWRHFHIISWAYFLFGVGYIVYLTFVVAWLREMQLGVLAATGVWFLLGLAAMASGYLWKGAMARWQPTTTFAAASLCTALGTALPLVAQNLGSLLISAVLVGGSFFMVPGSMMALARKTLPQSLWAKAMNFFTLIFALGQAVGPVLAGWIADHYGMNAAMTAGAFILLLGAGLAKRQPERLRD
ncbi:MAG: YbfB/YjiJ family MFS transporter [Cytophagales bacterium]|nr:YbfB/YjiJ family MFS transporter [Cytophagales bacterium]